MSPWRVRDGRSSISSLLFAVMVGVGFAACGGPPKTECGAKAWAGRCKLDRVVTVREVALPIPHVVLEAWYTPEANPDTPYLTPPAIMVEFATRSRFEANLREHLDKFPTVSCSVAAPPPGECTQGESKVDVPPFEPPKESYGFEEKSSAGCAQIEDATARDQLPEIGRDSGSVFQDYFYFEPGSSELSTEALTLAGQDAEGLKQDATLECVAVVGQVAPGEAPTLAGERARAVEQALVDQGVDRKRLMAITATVSVYGDDTEKQLEARKLRRVMLRTILRRAPKEERGPE
jgi:hypothetical protein